MTNFLALFKVYFKQYFSFRKMDKGERNKTAWTFGIIGAVALVMIGLLCFGIFKLTGPLLEVGFLDYLLTIIFLVGAFMVFFFGMYTFMSVMFFSKDTEFLLSIPVKSMTVFSVKLLVVYLSELIFTVAVYVPVLISVAIAAGAQGVTFGAAFYIMIPLSAVLMPLIPLTLIALISFPLTYVSTFLKRFNILSGILFIGVFIGIMVGYFYLINSATAGIDGETIDWTQFEQVFKNLSLAFYPGYVLAMGMIGSGAAAAGNLGIFFGIVAGCIAVSFGLSRLLYGVNMTRSLEHVSKSRGGNYVIRETKSGNIVWTLMKRDFKELLKNSYLMFQSMLGYIILPVFIAFFSFSNLLSGGMNVEIEAGFYADINAIMMPLFFAVVFTGGTNYLAGIAFSREGQNFYILKTLPVSGRDIVKSKLYLSDLCACVSLLLSAILVGAGTQKWLNALLFFVLMSVFVLSVNAFSLKRDMAAPKLNWLSIKDIVKRNYRIMIPLFISMGLGLFLMLFGLIGVPLIVNAIGEGSSFAQTVGWGVFWGVFAILDIVLYLTCRLNLFKQADQMIENIEA